MICRFMTHSIPKRRSQRPGFFGVLDLNSEAIHCTDHSVRMVLYPWPVRNILLVSSWFLLEDLKDDHAAVDPGFHQVDTVRMVLVCLERKSMAGAQDRDQDDRLVVLHSTDRARLGIRKVRMLDYVKHSLLHVACRCSSNVKTLPHPMHFRWSLATHSMPLWPHDGQVESGIFFRFSAHSASNSGQPFISLLQFLHFMVAFLTSSGSSSQRSSPSRQCGQITGRLICSAISACRLAPAVPWHAAAATGRNREAVLQFFCPGLCSPSIALRTGQAASGSRPC